MKMFNNLNLNIFNKKSKISSPESADEEQGEKLGGNMEDEQPMNAPEEREKSEEEKILDGKRTEYAEAYKSFDKNVKNKYRKLVADNRLSVPKINDALEKAREWIAVGDAEILKSENEPNNLPSDLRERKNAFIQELTAVGLTEEIALEMYRAEMSKLEYDGAKENYREKFVGKKYKELTAFYENKFNKIRSEFNKEEEKEIIETLDLETKKPLYNKLVVQEYDALKEAKIEDWPPKEKGRIKKFTEWYLKQNKWARVGMSSVALGLTGAVMPGATAATVFGAIGYRLSRGLGSVVSGQIAGFGFEKAKTKILKKKYDKKFEDLQLKSNSSDIKEETKKYEKLMRKKMSAENKARYLKMIVMLGVGGITAASIGHLENAYGAGGGGGAHENGKAGATKTPMTPEDYYKNFPGAKHKPEVKFGGYNEVDDGLGPKPTAGAAEQPTTAETAAAKPTAPEAPAIKIEAGELNKVDTLSEAVEKYLKQSGVNLDNTKNNFIKHWLGDKTEITAENKDELLNKAIRKLSVENVDMDDNIENVKNLVYEGNEVSVDADGNVHVEKAGGAHAPKEVSEETLRQNAKAGKPKIPENGKTSDDLMGSKYKLKIPEKELKILGTEEYEKYKAEAPENLPVKETAEEIRYKLNENSSLYEHDLDKDGFLNKDEILEANRKIDLELNDPKYRHTMNHLEDTWASDDAGQNHMVAQHPGEIETIKDLKAQRDLLSEPLAKIRAAEIAPEKENLAPPEAEAKIAAPEEAAPKTAAEIIPEKTLGKLAPEADAIEEAVRDNNSKYFTGLTLGEVVDNKPELKKGIVEIVYYNNYPIEKLKINLNEKYFIIDNGPDEIKHSWMYGKNIDNMEKLRDFIKEEIIKTGQLDSTENVNNIHLSDFNEKGETVRHIKLKDFNK